MTAAQAGCRLGGILPAAGLAGQHTVPARVTCGAVRMLQAGRYPGRRRAVTSCSVI